MLVSRGASLCVSDIVAGTVISSGGKVINPQAKGTRAWTIRVEKWAGKGRQLGMELPFPVILILPTSGPA